MKKHLIVVIIILLTASFVLAGSIQLRPSLGYGFDDDQWFFYSSFSGLNFGFGILYKLQDNLGIELGTGYVPYSSKWPNNEKANFSYIPVDLTIKLLTKKGKIKPYEGFGPTFVFGGREIITSIDENSSFAYKTIYKIGYGLNATFGADYEMSNFTSLFGAVVIKGVIVKLDHSKETIKYTENGVDTVKTTYEKSDFTRTFISISINLGIAIAFSSV